MMLKKAICAMMISALLFGCLSGCGANQNSVTESATTAQSEYVGLSFEYLPSVNGYVCSINENAPESVVVPAVYEEKNVKVFKCPDGETSKVKELIFSDMDEYFYIGEKSFENSPSLESVTFQGHIDIQDGAFSHCPELKTVTFENGAKYLGSTVFYDCPKLESVNIKGEIDEINSSASAFNVFNECPLLKRLVLPSDHAAELIGCQISQKHMVGTAAYLEWYDTMKFEEAAAQARKELVVDYDESKRIDPSDASKYRDQLSGLMLLSTDPDCYVGNYDASMITEETEIWAWDYRDFTEYYPGTLVTDEKTEAVKNGEEPVIYVLVENLGYTPLTYNGALTYNQSNYRISFWNEETDELLAWFELRDLGYAPESFRSDEKYKYCYRDNYFRDEDGNALYENYLIEKYVYGIEKEKSDD